MPDPIEELEIAFSEAVSYRQSLPARKCAPEKGYREMLQVFGEPLPEEGSKGSDVIRDLARRGAPGLSGMTHPRFFGWVLGGSAPVGVAADWLVSAWGQNAALHASSPTAAAVEEIAANWLLEILDLPREAAVGFVTGGTVGNFTALAAARGAVLSKHGWNADRDGLFGAPPVTVFVGDDAHTSVFSALGYLGFGRDRICRIDTDAEGRMNATDLANKITGTGGPGIVIAQAGQINTGAFDPFEDLIEVAKEADAWVHVDGAFGLWARAHPSYRYLTEGIEKADSWSVDGHKWLQTPFDSGYAIVRNQEALETAMGIEASYLPSKEDGERIPALLVPELSRRARGVPTWAMLKHLGRKGVRELVGRHCGIAGQIAERLKDVKGIRVVNDVVLNQIIIAFGPHDLSNAQRKQVTDEVI
ncbi:MAG: aspartate aminotransferase family protein, partial [Roseibium sp.]|uniref:pyridoxal phosphate-dependent decarboxylase family protein n=1 Tax=Roseibium sp. TaxID=1936156 RepID=UPI00261C38DA